MTGEQRQVFAALLVLAVALLFVGTVSGTVLRHVVQIIPAIVALILVVRTPSWGAYAALPLFAFWLVIVILIWLFLLGLSRIANGHYTVAEVIATMVMASASVHGTRRAVSVGKQLAWVPRAVTIVAFGMFQLAAMWVSFLRPIATR